MKKILYLIMIYSGLSQLCKGQESHSIQDTTTQTEFYSNEFKWKILIPAGFESENAEQYAKLHKEGAAKLEKSLNGKIDDRTKQICSFKSEKFNYLEANEHSFDPKTDGDYLQICKTVDNIVFDNFKTQVPENGKIDSAFSTEDIDGLKFQCFKVTLSFDADNKMVMMMYTRLFEQKEFTVAMVYMNENKGKQLLAAWRRSEFEKLKIYLTFRAPCFSIFSRARMQRRPQEVEFSRAVH